jgi:hypothetical protein
VNRTARDLAIEAQVDRRLEGLFRRYHCESAGGAFWVRQVEQRKGGGKGWKGK